jgi:hypothetical protein
MALNKEQIKAINEMVAELIDHGEVVIELGTYEASAFISAVSAYLPREKSQALAEDPES